MPSLNSTELPERAFPPDEVGRGTRSNMPLRLRAILRHLKRLFAGPGTLSSAARSMDVLCPEETVEVSPAIYLDSQIERITGAPSFTTIEFQVEQATVLQVTHAPTIAYHIQDATVLSGSVYAGRLKHVAAEVPPHRVPFFPSVHLQSAALASSLVGSKFFGHWLTDDCTLYLLAEQFSRPLVLRTAGYRDLANYETFFGQNWMPTDAASVDELIIFQDFSQNSFKAQRYETLHHRLKKHFPESKGSDLVYLKRGLTGAPRLVDNENDVLDALTRRGFIVADIASDSIAVLLSKIINAKIVVSIEGSHIGHCCVALPTGGGLIALQVEDKFSGVHRGWAEARSIRYGFVVGTKANNGFHFAASEILRTVDLMLNAL